MTRIILLRACATDFDDEGRIKGTLNIPLNQHGTEQAGRIAPELADEDISIVYFSPCQSAEETAKLVAEGLGVRCRSLKSLHNLDQGLWQGKLIDELKEKQKKVYRQAVDQPETVCPPEGELVSDALLRVKNAIDKLIMKHRNQVVALVAPEPMTSMLDSYLRQTELGDLWSGVCDCGSWRAIDVEPQRVPSMVAHQH